MVGGLNLPNLCADDPLDMNCKAERVLDSPDSGLPPSPGPSAWCGHKSAASPVSEDEGRGCLVSSLPTGSPPQLQALSYGVGIELDPLPPKQIRYTSSVHYNSERHFIQHVALQPRGQGLERCSQTFMALPHSTWRYYKTQLDFQPRQRAQRFQSTTIVYPKHTSTIYTTELSYDRHCLARRFLSSVTLGAANHRKLHQ